MELFWRVSSKFNIDNCFRILKLGGKTLKDFPDLKDEIHQMAHQRDIRFAYATLVDFYRLSKERDLLTEVFDHF